MKTLLLTPPSFPQFDGGAGSRWPATREITSFWYPVWLAYPAGIIPESRLLDAPPHGITPEETIAIASQYDFVTLYTSTVGWQNDVRLAEMMKTVKPARKIAFVGPPVTVQPAEALQASSAIDFVVRKEIDYPLAEFAAGKSLAEIAGVSFKHAGKVVHNPPRPLLQDLDALPFASSTSVTSISQSIMSLFCCIHISRFIPRAVARRCAPSACGRKLSAAMPGAHAALPMSSLKSGGRKSSSLTCRSSSLTMTPLPGGRGARWRCVKHCNPYSKPGRVPRACTRIRDTQSHEGGRLPPVDCGL
jgi:hypothetical protein